MVEVEKATRHRAGRRYRSTKISPRLKESGGVSESADITWFYRISRSLVAAESSTKWPFLQVIPVIDFVRLMG